MKLDDLTIEELKGAILVLDAGRVQPYGYVRSNRKAAYKVRSLIADAIERKERKMAETYPLKIRVSPNVRDELITGNNADQIGATPGDYRKEAFVRSDRAIVINDRDEHEYILMCVDDHIDRAQDWGFDMAWFVRSARRIRRELFEAHAGDWNTESAPYLKQALPKGA